MSNVPATDGRHSRREPLRRVGGLLAVGMISGFACWLVSRFDGSSCSVEPASVAPGEPMLWSGKQASGETEHRRPFGDATAEEYFVYSHELATKPLLFRSYRLLGRGTGVPPEVPGAPTHAVSTVIVVAGVRGLVDPGASCQEALRDIARAEVLPWKFHVVPHRLETRVPTSILLTDDQGRPWGPIRDGSQVRLPRGFSGHLVAEGYAPARVHFNQLTGCALGMFRSAAWLRGQLVGSSLAEGKLTLYDVQPDPWSPSHEQIRVEASGHFEAGPLPVGEKRLRFSSPVCCLRPADCVVRLEPGMRDLGMLRLESLHGLHVRVNRADRARLSRVFLSLCLRGYTLPNSLGALDVELPDSLSVRLGPYQNRAILVEAWTADGWYGCAGEQGVLPEETSAEAPATIELRAPGAVRVTVATDPFPLPEGCGVLVVPSEYHRERYRTVLPQRAMARERSQYAAVPRTGVVEFASVWPARVCLALIAGNGTVLASSSVRVEPGAMRHVALRPPTDLAVAEFGGTEVSRRFVVLSDQSVVARGIVRGGEVVRCLLPAGRYRWWTFDNALDSMEAKNSRASELVLSPGQVTHLLVN